MSLRTSVLEVYNMVSLRYKSEIERKSKRVSKIGYEVNRLSLYKLGKILGVED